MMVLKKSGRKDSISNSLERVLTRPRSTIFLFIHGIHYNMGGLCFIPASCVYFSEIFNQYEFAASVGGYFFSIGSFFLLIADLQEWWYFRIGCLFDCKYRDALEFDDTCLYKSGYEKMSIRWNRAKLGLNFFASACGSGLYLSGSILFIPGFEAYVLLGQLLIMAGSSVIFFSQVAKLYRLGCTSPADRFNDRFYVSNLFNSIAILAFETFTALGAVSFFVGTILFQPYFNVNNVANDIASATYLCGGISFTLSGLFLLYHRFCSGNETQ